MLSGAHGNLVILLDVDNTLLDNDKFGVDLGDRLEQSFGAFEKARYWSIIARRREELGFVDYLGSLQEFRAGLDDHAELLSMSQFLLEYPFAERVFPQGLEAIAHLGTFGRTVILSDGDIVFQPRKVQRSGVWSAVEGHVLIYVHKEKMLEQMQRRYPAKHYVMVDDKPNLLAAMKLVMGSKLTTIFVRQGHYAMDPKSAAVEPAPDRVIERIGDLTYFQLSDFKVPT
jgi:FMN phosphatase YigB (HAD superfamily)